MVVRNSACELIDTDWQAFQLSCRLVMWLEQELYLDTRANIGLKAEYILESHPVAGQEHKRRARAMLHCPFIDKRMLLLTFPFTKGPEQARPEQWHTGLDEDAFFERRLQQVAASLRQTTGLRAGSLQILHTRLDEILAPLETPATA